MCYKNGIFKTNITKIFDGNRFTIKIESKSELPKRLLIIFDEIIKYINSDNIFIAIRQIQSLILNINIYNYDECKIVITVTGKEQNLYVPVV